MATDPPFDIEQQLLAVLQKQGRDYLTVKQMVAGLPSALRQQLALTINQPITAMLRKLTPYLGQRLQVYKGARSSYIGHKLPPEELILRRLRQRSGVSSKQLGTQLPMAKTPYIAALNTLLKTGTVRCTLRENHTPYLMIAEAPAALPETASSGSADDRAAFKSAYDRVGQGEDFVRIHRVYDGLGWPRERFERVLIDLMTDYTIELHGGDPSRLSAAELRHSFTDAHGTLYLTLSWRGQP